MPEKKKAWTTIALVLFLSLVMAATFGGLYMWDKAKADKQTMAEKTAKKSDTKTEEEKEEAEVKAPDGSYKGWLTYENTAMGYTMKYPPDWTYTLSTTSGSGDSAEYVTFNNDDKDYAFSFGLRKAGSATVISGRTGLGVGEAEAGGTVKILGQDVDKTYFVDNGRISTIFYASGLAGLAKVGDNEIAAELRVPGYDDKSLKGSPQETIADMIISSLSFK